MSLKSNIIYNPDCGHEWHYTWHCEFEELIRFKTWTELVSVYVFWGNWDENSEENRKELEEYGFPMNGKEYEYLQEYTKMMEE